MNNITLLQPGKIVFGTGCLKQFCDDYIALGHKRLFVLTVPVIRPMIAEMTETLESKGISIEESTDLRIVISALEIVERGFSVLGLTTMPDYALHTHTKPHGFRVGIFTIWCFSVL